MTLEAFRFGREFISWIKLPYSDASVLLKIGEGFRSPVPVENHQAGNPLFGMLYALTIEPPTQAGSHRVNL